MLIAALLLALHGGHSHSALDISGPVKEYVTVPARAEQIIAVNKEMIDGEAAFESLVDRIRKRLADANDQRLASREAFAQAFASYDREHAAARERSLNLRFAMRELMTAEEWRNVFAAASKAE